MTESGELTRASETVHVSVLRARHLRGSKGEAVTSFAKVEFDGKSLGESAKVDSGAEQPAEYKFGAAFDCSFADGACTLDDVASKPVLVTVTEVLPKEKKQKEEKSAVLGQCTVDLLPLLLGAECEMRASLALHPVVGAAVIDNPDDVKAELDVVISVNEPLLSEEQLAQSNLLTVRVGSAYSLPEAWTAAGTQFSYVVGMPVPSAGGKSGGFVLFNNGSYKLAGEREPKRRPMKWHGSAIPSAAQCIPDGAYERPHPDDEKGDFSGKDYQDFRGEVETEKNRVTWDVERRCYVDADVKSTFRMQIAHTRFWPVEIMRTVSQPKVAAAAEKAPKKEKAGKADGGDGDDGVSYHGVAYVDLGPLLYPGVTTVAGAYRVHPFNEHELEHKTMRKTKLAEEFARAQSSTSRGTGVSPMQKAKAAAAAAGAGAQQASSKRGSAVKRTESMSESEQVHSVEGQAYTDARCYLYLEFALARPLIPRRQPEELAALVSEYIPPRLAVKVAVGGAEKAVADYHSQLASVSAMVLGEFRGMFGDEILEGSLDATPGERTKRKKALMYQLNSSGKYFAFKEQLKHSVVKVVREKYLKTSTFKSQDGLQRFLSELYVYLIDEMHVLMGRLLRSDGQVDAVAEPEISAAQLKQFAEEAEVNGEYDIASKYYQDRIAKDESDQRSWFDYGSFSLLVGDTGKAKECFKECVAIDQSFQEGLLMYGILCSMDQDFKEAEAVFERATNFAGDAMPAALPWTVMALFYEIQGNEIRSEHALSEANKHNALLAAADLHKQSEETRGERQAPDPVASMASVPALNEAKSDLTPPKKPGSAASVASRSKVKPAGSVTTSSRSVHSPTPTNADAAPSKVPLALNSGQFKTIFLQAAIWLLDRKALNFAEMALAREILAPLGGASAAYYVALARLDMMRRRYAQARDSVDRATSMDNENPDGWALMGHLSYISDDFATARDCYERALAFVTDASEMHTIYLRLASIYLQHGDFAKAKRTYLLACKRSPTCVSWLGVGMSCYRLAEISEAEDALAEANVLNNHNAYVWGYLSLVCLQTRRKIEAEQSFKYAVKLGLDDDDLMEEIRALQHEAGFGDPSF